MSTHLNPSSQLGFTILGHQGSLTQTITRTLTITNPNELPIAFKVKNTAPKSYFVLPNSGRVESGQSVDLSVSLKEVPLLNAKCKDKFLIQSTLITPERESVPFGDLWTGWGTDDATKIYQQKLRVVHLPVEEAPIPEDATEQPSMVGSDGDASQFDTIRDISTDDHPAASELIEAGDLPTPEPQRVLPSLPAPERSASLMYPVLQLNFGANLLGAILLLVLYILLVPDSC
ncbi:PapD-like protein [Cantharellus anzutake]|uniref:PapD-like protein n=1 Tax=Cantharellus anzutake TaxID=1750568 RepID=UPI0019055688|nr:PapD-like protein [Cantharellus anzutake]KAF8335820.1 PapD-like protein [Cantharellus anzutake]